MRKERGISLVALIFTIIVIIILASIAIYYGVNKNLQEATFDSGYGTLLV
jgi:type II secretory pathway pseudopilin PulG